MADQPLGDLPRLIQLLSGRWEGGEQLYLIPDSLLNRPADGKCTYTPVQGESAIVLDYTQLVGGKVTVRGHGMMRWDGGTMEVVLRWWDAGRTVERELRGRLTDPAMVLVSQDQPALSVTWIFGPAETHIRLWEEAVDGVNWEKRTMGTYRRAKSSQMAMEPPVSTGSVIGEGIHG